MPLEHARAVLDRLYGARSDHDVERRKTRMAEILAGSPRAVEELFREQWRGYIKKEMESGRSFKSIMEVDKPGPEADAPEGDVYEALYKAVLATAGSPAAVERIVGEVVQEFRPKRKEQ